MNIKTLGVQWSQVQILPSRLILPYPVTASSSFRTPDAAYTESVYIEFRIDALDDLADIDGNGQIDALTDGLLMLRYLFGLEGDTLITGVIAQDATRTSSADIEAHLKTLMP